MHRLFLHNDDLFHTADRTCSAGQVGLMNGWGVFSTLRVADGVLFAFDRHWDRMRHDAQRMHVPFPADPDWLHGRLVRLVEANEAWNATLRVVILRNGRGPFEGPAIERDFDLIAFSTDLTVWPDSVSLAVKPQGRHAKSEFAGAKITSWSGNLVWNEEARQRGFDEVVLLNERGEVSECTSANLFAIEGNRVWTPPIDSGCLPGITRALLLEEVALPGITVDEKPMLLSDLERADGVFITSSTRDALPVHSIESIRVRNEGRSVLTALQQALSDFRRKYVQNQHEEIPRRQMTTA